ncbi:MAG: hypothetical protein ACRD96_01930 [Bryobacteraceae bacterium]
MAVCILLATVATSQPPLTTIQDVLFKADGTRFNGLVNIQWTSFEGGGQTNIPQQMRTVRIIDGNLYVQLTPTTTAVPAAVYTVLYNSDGKIQFTEFWAVPPATTPLRVRDVRTTDPLFPPGGGIGELVIGDIDGLTEALAARPIKGAGFAVSRTARINASGEVDGVAGAVGDCVRVDGTSGPCGFSSFTFVDATVPSGTINGTNTTFTLPSSPNPAASLSLYRNGALKKPGVDYNLSAGTITFLPGQIPQTGDILLAWYRLASTAAPTPNFVDGQTPSGTVNGSNATFTVTNAPSPGAGLLLYRNGLVQKQGTDYNLSGTTITFLAGTIPQTGDVLLASYRW